MDATMSGRAALGRTAFLSRDGEPMTSLLYTAELDLAQPDIKPFLDWYAYRHAPDLVPLGFESSACYGATGGDMNLFDIYEIPNHDLFYGAGYRRMNERDKYAASILEKRRNKAHTIYRQHLVDGLSPDANVRIDTDWITVSRFDSALDANGVAAVLSELGEAWRRDGVAAVRFGSRTTDHPVYTTTRPHFMVLLEWQHRASAAKLIGDLTQKLTTNGGISRQITFEGHRIYPWPNN
jgi:hypothetical protein